MATGTVYLLLSHNGQNTYIGSTKDFERRFKEHNSGRSKSTAPYRPWRVLARATVPYEELRTVEFRAKKTYARKDMLTRVRRNRPELSERAVKRLASFIIAVQ